VEAVSTLLISFLFHEGFAQDMVNMFGEASYSYVLLIIFNIIGSILFYLLFFYFLNRKKVSFKKQNSFMIFLFLFLQFLYISFLINFIFNIQSLLLFYQVLIISMPIMFMIFSFYLFYINTKRQNIELETIHMKKIITVQSQHIKEIIEQNNQIEKLKHDFSTHSKVLYEMAKSGKNSELQSYLQQFAKEHILDPLFFCTRNTVNAILSSKYKIAKESNIDLQIYFSDKGAEKIDDINLCSVVSNLLQNGIEACERLSQNEKRYIRISASEKADCFIITQINSSLEPNDGFKTIKSDPANHGLGLKIIKDIAKKYNGNAVFEYTDGVFKSTVMLKGSGE
jgi:signal transduction histidine kinase